MLIEPLDLIFCFSEMVFTLFLFVRLTQDADADGQFDDEDINEIISYCQAWSKRLPIIFPDRNITQKDHVLSFNIPEYLRKSMQKRIN